MADKVVLVDTSILIDYYRKTDKGNTAWIGQIKKGYILQFPQLLNTRYILEQHKPNYLFGTTFFK